MTNEARKLVDLFRELEETDRVLEYRTAGAKNKAKNPDGTLVDPPEPKAPRASGGRGRPPGAKNKPKVQPSSEPDPNASTPPSSPTSSPAPSPSPSSQTPAQASTPPPIQPASIPTSSTSPQVTATQAAVASREMEIWEYVESTSKILHKYVLQKGFKEIVKNRESLWPGIIQESYINKFLLQFSKDPTLFSFPKGLKTSGFKLLDRKIELVSPLYPDEAEVERNQAVGTISGASPKSAKPDDLLFDFSPAPEADLGNISIAALVSNWGLNKIDLENIKTVLDSNPGSLRPITCFIVTAAYIFPSMYLAVLVNCWSASVISVNAQYKTLDFVSTLQLISSFKDLAVLPLDPAKWIMMLNKLIKEYFKDPNRSYRESVLKDSSEINAEWNKVRKMFKLLILSLGPQAA
jgi:hypothetical protein